MRYDVMVDAAPASGVPPLLLQCSRRYSILLLPSALQPPAAVQQLLGEHARDSGELTRPGTAFCAGLFVRDSSRACAYACCSSHICSTLRSARAFLWQQLGQWHCTAAAALTHSAARSMPSARTTSGRSSGTAPHLHCTLACKHPKHERLRPLPCPSISSFLCSFFRSAQLFASRLACVILLFVSPPYLFLARGHGCPSVPSVSVLPLMFLSSSPLGRRGARACWLASRHGWVSGRQCECYDKTKR